jgi:hypothetical protein
MSSAIRATWHPNPGAYIPWIVPLGRLHCDGQKIRTENGQLAFSPYTGGSIELAYCELPNDEENPFANQR